LIVALSTEKRYPLFLKALQPPQIRLGGAFLAPVDEG
jgi:hypothetical protein